ncbi:MAG: replicative DNA helicase [Candidatus Latescibacteria bacterium]|nr:replicative DNA helicase [Candidatus Latescibacterota bacterium]
MTNSARAGKGGTPQEQRIPPQALEAERAVLGAMMLGEEAIAKIIEFLDETCFYRDSNRRVFDSIIALYQKGEPADLVTVREELKSAGNLEAAGGEIYLTELLDEVATTANVEHYARIVLESAIKRKLINALTGVVGDAYDTGEEAVDLLDRAEQTIFGLSERRLRTGARTLEEVLHTTFELIEKAHQRKGGLSGVPTGFSLLDEKLAGLQPSDLIIIAGRPSMGKTAFALNVARNAAVEGEIPVAFFSIEMSAHQLAQRMLCSEARLDIHAVRTGRLPPTDWQKLSMSVGRLAEAKVYIDDSASLSVLEFRAKARRLKAEHDIGLVIVDYLQLMTGPRAESRQIEITMISRALKALAKELAIPVVALSQLSRAVETRGGNRRPQLSDLRESGALEQDADVVLFMYREEYYQRDKPEVHGQAELIIGKQRNGPIGVVPLMFHSEYARFDNLAPEAITTEAPF